MTDILIIGAGPAGMAAAITASHNGADVTVVDNRIEPGGNIYSSLISTKRDRPKIWEALGSSYHNGQELIENFLQSKINYLPQHSLWHLDPDGSASVRGSGGLKNFNAKKVILATGAQERPMPIENWTLPGVMGVGAAQILLKNNGHIPNGQIVIIGTGPLPLLYAAQVLAVGGKIHAFVQPKYSRDISTCFRNLLGAWHGRSYLNAGLLYLMKRALAKIPVYRDVTEIQIVGNNFAEGVQFKTNTLHKLKASSILLHDGVVPNVNAGAAAGLQLVRNSEQDCWAPKSNNIIKVAGDAGGIQGAKAAELSGKIATLEALNLPIPYHLKSKLAKEKQFRSFIDAVYPPIGNAVLANDATLICRCESVSKGEMVTAIAYTGTDPNRLKTNLRCGMGPCQGRMCSLSIEAIISSTSGEDKNSIGLHRLRNPIVPITFRDLASLETDDT